MLKHKKNDSEVRSKCERDLLHLLAYACENGTNGGKCEKISHLLVCV